MTKPILFIIAVCLSGNSLADVKPSKHRCLDLVGGLQVHAKVGEHTYDADYWNWGTPRTRIVLVANTDFKTTGVVYRHFWAEVTPKAEKITIQLTNGFSQEFNVIRESEVCTRENTKAKP